MADYISREAAIKVLCCNCQDIGYDENEESCWCMKKDRFNQIPAADVRPVASANWKMEFIGGNWIDHWNYFCPVCHEEFMDLKKSNFCPCCGTYMMDPSAEGRENE